MIGKDQQALDWWRDLAGKEGMVIWLCDRQKQNVMSKWGCRSWQADWEMAHETDQFNQSCANIEIFVLLAGAVVEVC